MDNDTTTFARAKEKFDPNLKKFCDSNHTKKNFVNKLYDLKKEKKLKLLTPMTIRHLKKLFSYAIEQNKGDPVNLKSTIESIVPHTFGMHNQCKISWCSYHRNPDSYVPKKLPHSR